MVKDITVAKVLIARKILSEKQVKAALEQKKTSGKSLVKIFIEENLIEEDLALTLYADALEIPYANLKYFPMNSKVVEDLPESLARRFRAIPIGLAKGNYLIAMSDPEDVLAIDEIERKLKANIRPVLVKEVDLVETIDSVFRKTSEISSLVGQVGEGLDTEGLSGFEDELSVDTNAPIIQLLNSLFDDALASGVSDIHIEPAKDNFKIRQRIDGVLHEQVMKDKSVLSAMISRIKLMAKLNISEKRLPQDGSFAVNTSKSKFAMRVSTLPVKYGESVVMRILRQDGGLTELSKIHMPINIRKTILKNIHQPNGVVLVTGPTGSGKSTLLYAMLNELNSPETKIITAEDPIEYTMPGLNQVHVQSKIGLTFASVLRSMLRQDPDIIMVGEIRDLETAEISLQAAMTGHLVFSTVHTNDSVSTPERLLDLGVQPFLVTSSIRIVVAQRLVRKNCDICAEEYVPDKNEKVWLDNIFKNYGIPEKFYQGKGCSSCNKTGYKGRLPVIELLELTEDRLDYLRRNELSEFKQSVLDDPNFKTLGMAALEHARDKLTSLKEVVKLVGGIE